VQDVGDVAWVQEGFGVRRAPGTLVEHRGLTSMLVPGGVASTRPGRCQRPERCGAPGAVQGDLGSRVLRDCQLEGHGFLQQWS
jgi:hypothetical protein